MPLQPADFNAFVEMNFRDIGVPLDAGDNPNINYVRPHQQPVRRANPRVQVALKPFAVDMLVFPEEKPIPKRDNRLEITDMTSLSYALGRVLPGRFGFELEVEGVNLPVIDGGWIYKRDGSLRGENLEYILRHPINLPEFPSVFEKLVRKLTDEKVKLNFSFRTSTHVHLNVLDLNKHQIQALFYLSHLVEDALVNYSGATRIGNRFCLRTKDAMWKVRQFKKWLTNPGFGPLNQEELKYSAINIATIMSYGSIEFRSLRGTIEKDVVLPWLEVLNNLYEIAKIVPIIEMEKLARDKPVEILNVVFKEHLSLFSYPNMEKDVIEAYDRLIEIPYVKVRQ